MKSSFSASKVLLVVLLLTTAQSLFPSDDKSVFGSSQDKIGIEHLLAYKQLTNPTVFYPAQFCDGSYSDLSYRVSDRNSRSLMLQLPDGIVGQVGDSSQVSGNWQKLLAYNLLKSLQQPVLMQQDRVVGQVQPEMTPLMFAAGAEVVDEVGTLLVEGAAALGVGALVAKATDMFMGRDQGASSVQIAEKRKDQRDSSSQKIEERKGNSDGARAPGKPTKADGFTPPM
jgi:hypothetical protein